MSGPVPSTLCPCHLGCLGKIGLQALSAHCAEVEAGSCTSGRGSALPAPHPSSFSPTPAGWRSTRVGGVHPSNLTQLPLLGMQALSSHGPPRPVLVTGLKGSTGHFSWPSSSIGCNGHCGGHGGTQVRCLGWYPSCHTALV